MLRGLAALAVVFHHVAYQASVFTGRLDGPAYAWLHPFPWETGVDVFFVISGFVMVWSSQPLFGRPGASLEFARRRLTRVVPLYWAATSLLLVTTLVLPDSVSEPAPSAALVVTSFLFLPWRRPDGLMQPLLRLGWTLNYEMMFYAIFALFVRWPARIAVPCVITIIAGLATLGWFMPPAPAMLDFWTDPVIFEFAVGAALGLVAPRIRLPALVRLALVPAGLVGIWVADQADWPHNAAFILPCLALVAASTLGRPRSGHPVAERAAIRFGDMSYALYLVHPYPMRGLALLWSRAGWASGAAGVIGYVAAAVAASLALAWLVHVRIERPLTRAARRLWSGERALAF